MGPGENYPPDDRDPTQSEDREVIEDNTEGNDPDND